MTGCYAKGCRNASCHGLKMSFFPRNPERRAQWIGNCKKYCATTYRLPNDHSALCEFHFGPDMWEKPRVDGKKKLKISAVPTIFGDKVPQLYQKGVDNVKVSTPKKVLGPMNTNNRGYQVVALPVAANTYKILLPVSQSTPGQMDNFRIQTIKDERGAATNQSPSTTKTNAGLLLNNGISHFIGGTLTKVTPTVKFQNGPQTVQQCTKAIVSDIHSKVKSEENEDSDLDSFIANNFEPVSDEEDYGDDNFEPVPDEIVVSSGEDDGVKEVISFTPRERKKGVISTDQLYSEITSEEIHLLSLKKELLSTAHTMDKSCSRCKRTEKVFEKSERVRIMMKKKFKQKQKEVKKTIESLEDRIKTLESSHYAFSRVLENDQMRYLLSETNKIPKWSDSTLQKAHECWLACGTKGYKFLLNQHWPLPSLKSLRHNKNRIFMPHDDTIDYGAY